LAVVAVACSGGADTPTDGEPVAVQTAPLYIAGGASLWPPGSVNGSTGTAFIPVCWANGIESNGSGNPVRAMNDPDFLTMQKWTWEALATGWMGVANIAFTGWQECQSNNSSEYGSGKYGPMIMLRWNTSQEGTGGNTGPVGYTTSGWTGVRVPTAQALTQQWTSKIPNYSPESDFKGAVLHEFGHALGFAHEVDRPDNPAGGGSVCHRTTDNNGTYATPYDYDSIMSYSYGCPPDASGGLKVNGIYVLSPTDVWGIQSLYGRKPQYSLVNLHAGRCLSIPGASPQLGIQTDLWDCGDFPDQRWVGGPPIILGSVEGPVAAHLPISTDAYRCLDVAGFGTSNGTSAQSWDCTGGSNQSWAFPVVQVVGHGGNCLQRDHSGNVFMQACSEGIQPWFFDQGRRTLEDFTGKCLQAQGSFDGAPVTVAPCNGSQNQQWWLYDGEMRSMVDPTGNSCLDVAGGGVADGTPVQIWQCLTRQTSPGYLAALNQKWALRGNLQGYGQNCLDAAGAGMGAGNPVQMWQCLYPSQPQQVWTYYF
jgi:hypothetical protein